LPPSNEPVTFNFKRTISDNRMIGLWRMLAGYRTIYTTAILALGIAAILNSAIYLLIRDFVDRIIYLDNVKEWLPVVMLGFVGIALLRGLMTFVSGQFSARTGEGIALRLRDYLFDHIQRLTFSYHDKMQTGELIQRCTSDVDAIRRFYQEQAVGIGRISSLFIVNLVVLMTLNWQLALLSVIVIPFIILMSLFFFKRVSQAYEAFQEQEARLSTTLQENLSGVRVVKAFARQDYEQNKFERENTEKYRLGKRFMLMHSTFWPVTDILTGAQMLAGYYIGARMAIDGTITVGTYLAYAGMIIWIIYPIRNLGRLIVQMSTGLVSYHRVMEIVKQDREPLYDGTHVANGNLRGAFVFDKMCFAYEQDNPVLKDISFTVEPGQAVALLGSTGSGKTSLTGLLSRFYDYSEGNITLDGVELREYSRDYLRRQISIVQQEPFLFSRTIRENITYGVGKTVSDEAVEEAARAAAIHEVIMTFPDGYNTLVGERGVTLSGGQKQRVTIARALLKDPRILILDDATSSVDSETEESIREALNDLMKDRTTFIVAHRVQSVMNADLILVLDKGKIVERGTHDELLAQNGTYRRIYDLQARIEEELEKELASVRLSV
jgi:ATP-binding cassette subfamily B protein